MLILALAAGCSPSAPIEPPLAPVPTPTANITARGDAGTETLPTPAPAPTEGVGALREAPLPLATQNPTPTTGRPPNPTETEVHTPDTPTNAPATPTTPPPSGPDGAVLTPSGQAGDPVLVGAGDIASCDHDLDEATAKLLDGIRGTVFTLGDNAYDDGTESEFKNCYNSTWGRHKERTRPAAGNHEYRTDEAAPYYRYFGSAAGEQGKGYYSYDLGTWHIVVLNSNCKYVGGCDAGSDQERWLRSDLAAHPARCTLAYWHHPRFSSGKYHDDHPMEAMWEALYEAGSDLVLAGHDHNYQRFAPQNPSGEADPERGIRQIVVGTGGAKHYEIGDPVANSEAYSDSATGVLKLTLHTTSYDWEFVPIPGESFTDSGSAPCS
jgi:acid phosphatase type 7